MKAFYFTVFCFVFSFEIIYQEGLFGIKDNLPKGAQFILVLIVKSCLSLFQELTSINQ